MADFVNDFWSWFIIVLTLGGIVAMFLLNRWMSEGVNAPPKEPQPMGHVWDEDLQELNNPLPKWWLNLFYITLVFGIVYLILYPGLGKFGGALGWTAQTQYEAEIARADKRYGPLYQQYLGQDLRTLVHDEGAMKTGARLFTTYCTVCHGSDAGGAPGFPNLRDKDWLYGGKPEAIKLSIMNGRNGVMPAWEQALGRQGVVDVAEYVLSLSGRKVDINAAEAGAPKFAAMCSSCHGKDGRGNTAIGAPDLTDNIWLYGGSQRTVMESISKGRKGSMPAHSDFLGEAKVHLLAAYVYGLSGENLTK